MFVPRREWHLTDRSRDGDPIKDWMQLEGENHDVDPGDLGNGNGVRRGQRSVQHSLGTRQDLVEGRHHGDFQIQ